ncbi:MAG: esterase [Lachnospiraceae bacterium]|nr:esterase [Lachnospiraceae bacterium]
MKEMMKNRTYRDKIVYCAKDPKFVLIQMVDEDMIDMLSEQYHIISSVIECPFLLAGYVVNDWNKDLSPWKAKAVFGKKNFEGAARETLDDLCGSFIPQLKKEHNLDDDICVILGGYSLAGLFSLFSAYQTDVFDAVMAASASVWFSGWIDYAKANRIKCKNVYLSLGDRESDTKNPVMKKVGECMKTQFALLFRDSADNCALEFNEGNHFTDVAKRCAKGYEWCIEQTKCHYLLH